MVLTLKHIGGQTMDVIVVGVRHRMLQLKFPMDLTPVYEIWVKSNRIVGLPAWKAADHDRLKDVYWKLDKHDKQRMAEEEADKAMRIKPESWAQSDVVSTHAFK